MNDLFFLLKDIDSCNFSDDTTTYICFKKLEKALISLEKNSMLAIRSLREKCPYSELFWSAFSRIWTEYGEILCISLCLVRILENANQNNSEYGHF